MTRDRAGDQSSSSKPSGNSEKRFRRKLQREQDNRRQTEGKPKSHENDKGDTKKQGTGFRHGRPQTTKRVDNDQQQQKKGDNETANRPSNNGDEDLRAPL